MRQATISITLIALFLAIGCGAEGPINPQEDYSPVKEPSYVVYLDDTGMLTGVAFNIPGEKPLVLDIEEALTEMEISDRGAQEYGYDPYPCPLPDELLGTDMDKETLRVYFAAHFAESLYAPPQWSCWLYQSMYNILAFDWYLDYFVSTMEVWNKSGLCYDVPDEIDIEPPC